jgi:hypothetical protein
MSGWLWPGGNSGSRRRGAGLRAGAGAGVRAGAGAGVRAGAGAGVRAGAGAGVRAGAGAGVRVLAGAAVVTGAVVLAACGSVPASSSAGSLRASAEGSTGTSGSGESGSGASSAGAPGSGATRAPGAGGGGGGSPVLCRDAATVTSLIVVRNYGIRVPDLQATLPTLVAVTSPPRVRAVARALCGLPPMPRGVLECPALLVGTGYTLHFAVGGQPLPMVTIEATGCEAVTGVGPVRRALSPGFWRVLAEATGTSPLALRGGPGPPPCSPVPTRINKTSACPDVARPAGAAEPGGAAAP